MGWLLTINKNIKNMSNGPNYIDQSLLSGQTNYQQDTSDVADSQLKEKHPELGPTPAEQLQLSAKEVLNSAATAVDMQLGSKETHSPSNFSYSNALSSITGGGNTMAQNAQMGVKAGQGIRQVIQSNQIKKGGGIPSKWGTDMLQNNPAWIKKNPGISALHGWG